MNGKIHTKNFYFFFLFRMTLNSKLKDTITNEERNFMRQEKAFLVFFTVLFLFSGQGNSYFHFALSPTDFGADS